MDTDTEIFKFGLLRANENEKKVEVAWPYEFCYFGISGKNPQYEDLSPFQFIFLSYWVYLRGANLGRSG